MKKIALNLILTFSLFGLLTNKAYAQNSDGDKILGVWEVGSGKPGLK